MTTLQIIQNRASIAKIPWTLVSNCENMLCIVTAYLFLSRHSRVHEWCCRACLTRPVASKNALSATWKLVLCMSIKSRPNDCASKGSFSAKGDTILADPGRHRSENQKLHECCILQSRQRHNTSPKYWKQGFWSYFLYFPLYPCVLLWKQ